MTKHKPATPLPWQHIGPSYSGPDLYSLYTLADNTPPHAEHIRKQDARYIAHAANAYPRLVDEALSALGALDYAAAKLDNMTINGNRVLSERRNRLRALLRELGEE